MSKPQAEPKRYGIAKLILAFAIAQLAFNVFIIYRLQHQEQMNREQVKFDTTIAAKVFGYDAARTTNTFVVDYPAGQIKAYRTTNGVWHTNL